MENKKNTENINKKPETNKTTEDVSLKDILAQMAQMNKLMGEMASKIEAQEAELNEYRESAKIREAEWEEEAEAKEDASYPKDIDSNRMVEIVHLANRAGGLTTAIAMNDGRILNFTKYGDSIRVKYYELQNILNTYHKMFYEDRLFTLGKNDQDVAEAERLPKFDDKCLTKEEVQDLVSMPVKQLVDLYNRVCDTHKDIILSTWQEGYFSGDAAFRDLSKINALNQASDFKLKTVYDNLTGQNS